MKYIFLIENVGIVKDNDILSFIFVGTQQESDQYTLFVGENKKESFYEYKSTKLGIASSKIKDGIVLTNKKH